MSTVGKKPRRYHGELAKPIQLALPIRAHENPLIGLQNEDYDLQMAKLAESISKSFEHKTRLLFEHYGIHGEDPWPELALRLALDHVPGFRLVGDHRRKGQPKTWSLARLLCLMHDVDAVKRQKSCSYKGACRVLARDPAYRKTWGRPPNHKGTPAQWVETLESRLQDIRRLMKRTSALP